MHGPLFLSLEVSLASTLLAVLLGTAIAYVLAKRRFPGRALAQGLSVLPMVLPPTVLGYALLVGMGRDSAVGRWYQTLMVGGNIPTRTHTLPLAVYDAWQSDDHRLAQGLSLMLSAVALVVSITAARLTQRE